MLDTTAAACAWCGAPTPPRARYCRATHRVSAWQATQRHAVRLLSFGDVATLDDALAATRALDATARDLISRA